MRSSLVLLAACFTAASASSYPKRGTIPNGQPCQADTDCVSNQCVIPPAGPSECGAVNLALGANCVEDVQCASGYCPNSNGSKSGVMYKCAAASDRPLLPGGSDCYKGVECLSGTCDANLKCTDPDPGTPGVIPCTKDADCDPNGQRCFPTIADPKKSTCQYINLPLGLNCVADSQCVSTYCNKTKLTCDLVENKPGGNTTGGGDPPGGTTGGTDPNVGQPAGPQVVTTTLPGGGVSTVFVTPTTTPRAAAAALQVPSGLVAGVVATVLGMIGGVGLIL